MDITRSASFVANIACFARLDYAVYERVPCRTVWEFCWEHFFGSILEFRVGLQRDKHFSPNDSVALVSVP